MKSIQCIIVLCILFLSGNLFPQVSADVLKREAVKHMQAARYGEAIDLLNKYVSANPHKADGLNLRGLCYEARTQYEWSVLDLRRAIKLEPKNKEIQTNLARVEKIWHQLLEKKIEGHKRELAINPNSAVDYLEIGKCKKNLGLWKEAEIWYDDYIKREEPSSDEVIRYSEILAHNNSIVKGEKILKKYVEKYPDDQRLWSRYGYFTLWLGKNKIAIKAFENALAIKPYFVEAQEGLNQAKGNKYIFEWVDTTARYKQYKAPPEYAIDKYYRIVRRNPSDVKTRYLLIDELLKVERIEEAYQQLQMLAENQLNEEKFQVLWDSVTTYREKTYNIKVKEYSLRIEKDPTDKLAVLRLASYYSNLKNFDSAIVVLQNFLDNKPKDDDSDVRYELAKNSAWNYQFENAIDQLNILLSRNPESPEYKLLRAQIAVWTVQDQEMALEYLQTIIEKDPDNVQALLGLVSIYVRERDFSTAKAFLDKAKELDPKGKEIENMENYFAVNLSLEEDRKNFEILVEARNLAVASDCEGSVSKYEEYFLKVSYPGKMVMLEYADVNACAQNINKAIDVYTQVLDDGYDYDVALLRAKAYLWSGDSVSALSEFKKLAEEDSSNFEAKLYLGDSYIRMKEYSEAEDIYEDLLETTTDTSQISQINLRLKWIPPSGFSNILSSFPTHIGFSPSAFYYSDNFDLLYRNVGGRLELGVNSFLSLGVSFSRGNLKGKYNASIYSTTVTKNFTYFKGYIFLVPVKNLFISSGFGRLTYQGTNSRNIYEASIKYEKPNVFSIYGFFEETDAGLVLYSHSLINYNVNSQLYKLISSWQPNKKSKLSGYFQLVDLSDGNRGNDLQLRFGRLFESNLWGGYEYFYSTYSFVSSLYFSPQGFESHSLWGEWSLQKDESIDVILGGKIGYVPMSDFILREISGEVLYKPFKSFTLAGKMSTGGTYRYDSNYRFFSATLSAYWNL